LKFDKTEPMGIVSIMYYEPDCLLRSFDYGLVERYVIINWLVARLKYQIEEKINYPFR
jgi:hypothetical protein